MKIQKEHKNSTSDTVQDIRQASVDKTWRIKRENNYQRHSLSLGQYKTKITNRRKEKSIS